MPTIGWLLVGLGALGCHELVLARVRPGKRRVVIRGLSLVVALAAAANAGPGVLSRLQPLLPSTRGESTPFTPDGDAALTATLANQRPDRPFPRGQSGIAVEEWRRQVLEALGSRVGLQADGAAAVQVDVLGSESVDGIRRSFVRFASWDGTTIPAYVFDPGGSRAHGAVLVIAGHGEGIRATAGLVDDYQHAAALSLARQGYVTLTPELRGFGLLGVNGEASHRSVAAAALAAGSWSKAVVVRDLSRALTALQKWPGVDPARLAVVGTSLGGELAVLLGVLDNRVRVVLSHSYAGSTGPETIDGSLADDAGQTPHGCHTVPGINRILVQEDWVRLLAPRPVLVVRGDRNTPGEAAGTFSAAVHEAFDVMGASDRFQVEIAPGGHEFYLEPSVRFLSRWL